MHKVKVIGFDADDTLWVNETFFQAAEKSFCALMADFLPAEEAARELFKTEMQNLELYGFGAKGFLLSAVETALRISNNTVPAEKMRAVLDLGKQLLDFPVELLAGVDEVLAALKPKYRLVMITKGDLLDQERKLRKSGLESRFHHIQILSSKEEKDYRNLFKTLGILPEEFLMVGNSMKSDILPVLNIGGFGVHVPFSVTWQHEKTGTENPDSARFRQITVITELLELLTK
jgi:putative hydrolase of the HAD superfamily